MNEPLQPIPDEQRQEYRITARETIYLELENAIDDAIPVTILVSTSLDMSANGLRVIIDQQLQVGIIARICVHFKNTDRQFLLTSETKWCRPYGENNEYLVGLSLFESEGTDIQEWKETIATLCQLGIDNNDSDTIFGLKN